MADQTTDQSPDDNSPIATLFATDPLNLTRENIVTIVEHLREQRSRFNLGDQSAGRAKPRKPTKGDKAMAIGGSDLLNSLDL